MSANAWRGSRDAWCVPTTGLRRWRQRWTACSTRGAWLVRRIWWRISTRGGSPRGSSRSTNVSWGAAVPRVRVRWLPDPERRQRTGGDVKRRRPPGGGGPLVPPRRQHLAVADAQEPPGARSPRPDHQRQPPAVPPGADAVPEPVRRGPTGLRGRGRTGHAAAGARPARHVPERRSRPSAGHRHTVRVGVRARDRGGVSRRSVRPPVPGSDGYRRVVPRLHGPPVGWGSRAVPRPAPSRPPRGRPVRRRALVPLVPVEPPAAARVPGHAASRLPGGDQVATSGVPGLVLLGVRARHPRCAGPRAGGPHAEVSLRGPGHCLRAHDDRVAGVHGGRPALLGRMTDVLAHRGPDGSGLLLARPTGEGFESTLLRTLAGSGDAARTAVVGLGSRRLAIIDTSERGLQPMVDRTGSVALVFNGELYNFRELRAVLQVRGCTFESGTDTEVFLAAYLAWGDGCLDRAKGMYGFALWDGRAGRLLIGRDRFGIKPLYYARVGDRVAFASEIKALLEAPWLPRIAHDDAVAEFLLHGNCDFAERTVFRDVHALPPGHKLVVDLRRRDLAVSPYYALRVATGSNGVQPDAGKLEQLRDLLEGSVRDHLVSDVPVGSCLSGGVDSSAVVGLMGKLLREQPEAATSLGGRIHTFTSSYDDDPSVDERQYALPVAASVGAQSHLVFPTAQDFVEQFPKMAYHFDMPFGTLSF